jgi:hypothetical protein
MTFLIGSEVWVVEMMFELPVSGSCSKKVQWDQKINVNEIKND